MGLIPVGNDQLAAVVTSLEMLKRPPLRPLPASPFRLARLPEPSNDKYRALFRRVGEAWLWYSRLVMEDARLAAILTDPAVEVHAVVDRAGIEVGMLELDFQTDGQCELSFLGLIPELAGKGHGRWLMAEALGRAWRKGIDRVWVHTCTLDHPRALGFYRASGFAPFKRVVETFPDPRLLGVLPREAAPHVPLMDPASRR